LAGKLAHSKRRPKSDQRNQVTALTKCVEHVGTNKQLQSAANIKPKNQLIPPVNGKPKFQAENCLHFASLGDFEFLVRKQFVALVECNNIF
jgi:hypothetical protein